jgi:hypothetical protein
MRPPNVWIPISRLGCITILITTLSLHSVWATKVYNIHWNSSNPIFRIDKTDNVIDVNAGNFPSEHDQVNIVCPVYKPNLEETHQERYIIYLVSKEEYDSCRITQPNPRIIAVCNRPYNFMYFTITFRSFTPTPGGLEFHPGNDYYFISTSSRNDLHRRVGGGCSSSNMRLIFKVASKNLNQDDDNHLTNKINEVVESSTPEAKRRYHPWHMPQQEPRQFDESSETSTMTTLYYPFEEMERAQEMMISSHANHKNSNINRGARKAFSYAANQSVRVATSSGQSQFTLNVSCLMIALANIVALTMMS